MRYQNNINIIKIFKYSRPSRIFQTTHNKYRLMLKIMYVCMYVYITDGLNFKIVGALHSIVKDLYDIPLSPLSSIKSLESLHIYIL